MEDYEGQTFVLEIVGQIRHSTGLSFTNERLLVTVSGSQQGIESPDLQATNTGSLSYKSLLEVGRVRDEIYIRFFYA